MDGTPVLAGTRVPVHTLFDYIEGGSTIEDLLEGSLQSVERRSWPFARMRESVVSLVSEGPGRQNGDLLRAAAAESDAFITVNRILQHQQNPSRCDIAVMMLFTQPAAWRLRKLVPSILVMLAAAPKRNVTEVG